MRTELRFNIKWFFSLAQLLFSFIHFVIQLFSCEGLVTYSELKCGKSNLTDSRGTISSPDYPSPFQGKVECEWRIYSPAESILKINILDLDIAQDEPCVKIPCCSQQGLMVPSEGGRGSKLLCGKLSVEKPIIVSQLVTVIRYFSTFTAKSGRGFEITYSIDMRACRAHELECINGKCIANDSFCNGINDCGDSSDEMYCPHIKRAPSLYDFYPRKNPIVENSVALKSCLDGWQSCFLSPGHCYSPQIDICDGEFDCPKGEDEVGCVSSCPDQIACSSGESCYYPDQRCNMIRNCRDNSDETGCPAAPCIAMQFTCLNRACVPGSVICDGNNDCGDFSDEKNCKKSSIGAMIAGLLSGILLFSTFSVFIYKVYSSRFRGTGFMQQLESESMDDDYMYREPPPAYSVAIGESQTPLYFDSDFTDGYCESDPPSPPPRILSPRLLPPRIPPPRILPPRVITPNRRRPRPGGFLEHVCARSRPRPVSHSTQTACLFEEQQSKIGRLIKNDSISNRPVIELFGFLEESSPTHNCLHITDELRNHINESPCPLHCLSSSRESITSSTSLEDHQEIISPCQS